MEPRTIDVDPVGGGELTRGSALPPFDSFTPWSSCVWLDMSSHDTLGQDVEKSKGSSVEPSTSPPPRIGTNVDRTGFGYFPLANSDDDTRVRTTLRAVSLRRRWCVSNHISPAEIGTKVRGSPAFEKPSRVVFWRRRVRLPIKGRALKRTARPKLRSHGIRDEITEEKGVPVPACQTTPTENGRELETLAHSEGVREGASRESAASAQHMSSVGK